MLNGYRNRRYIKTLNLFDCRIPYTALPESVLDLTSKVSLVMALEIYRLGSVSALEGALDKDLNLSLSPYERRKRSEVARELLRRGVIVRAEQAEKAEQAEHGSQLKYARYALVDLDMKKDRSLAKDRLVIPAQFDYRSLSVASIKLLLALHSLTRYSRTPFRLELTQTELASKTRLAEKSVRTALKELAEARLIKTEKLWRAATRITLLDPESGVELYFIGQFHRERLDRIPVFDRYKQCLQNFDPRSQLGNERGPVVKGTVCCPFCKGNKRTFVFEADELQGIDRWTCFKCKRSGDSSQLWAKLSTWIGKINWRTALAEVMQSDGKQEASRGGVERSSVQPRVQPASTKPSLEDTWTEFVKQSVESGKELTGEEWNAFAVREGIDYYLPREMPLSEDIPTVDEVRAWGNCPTKSKSR